MRAVNRLSATLMIGLLPLAAMAQDTQDAAEPQAAETPATDAPAAGTEAPATDAPASDAPASDAPSAPTEPGGDLATGQEIGAQTGGSGNQVYIREEHGAFEVRCLRAPEGQEDPCQLFQRLSDQQGNPTADVNFFDLPDGGDLAGGATILTPLQTLLTSQVTMSIDGGQQRRYPFAFCDAAGCYARLGFTAEDLGQFRRGATAKIVVVPALAPDQPAELDMSLAGFTAGLAAIEVGAE